MDVRYGNEEVLKYLYDKNGNRIQETKEFSGGVEVTSYQYDALGQLTYAADGNGIRTYVYDEFYNRIQKTDGEVSTAYTYNRLNQLVEEHKDLGGGPAVTSYIYDRRGNRIEEKEGMAAAASYRYDSMNRLVQAENQETVTEYQYDAGGNRIRSLVTEQGAVTKDMHYVVDQASAYGSILMAEDRLLQEETVFTYGLSLLSAKNEKAGRTSWYKLDYQNSITGLYDEEGRLLTEISYDEYGILKDPGAVSINGNIFSYTGHMYEDSTALYYAKARYYDQKTGSFISEDILYGNQQNPISRNRYIYVLNNPVSYIDPDGKMPVPPEWKDWTEVTKTASEWANADAGLPFGDALAAALMAGFGACQLSGVVASGIHQLGKEISGFISAVGTFFAGGPEVEWYEGMPAPCPAPEPPSLEASKADGNMSYDVLYGSRGGMNAIEAAVAEVELGNIAGRYGNLKCKEAADAMERYLKKRKLDFKRITMKYPLKFGTIISLSREAILGDYNKAIISENGLHYGIEYNGIVHCNVHPLGLPRKLWELDFWGPGQAFRTITPP